MFERGSKAEGIIVQNDPCVVIMRLEGVRIAILAENQYEDLEPWYPYYRPKEDQD